MKKNNEGSGKSIMHLQAAVNPFDSFVRCIGLSPQTHLVKYDPDAPLHDRYTQETNFVTAEEAQILRTRYIHFASGEGRAEALWEAWWMANALGRAGVPNQVDSWGAGYPHNWLTWRAMMPQILGEWTRGA